MTNDEIDNLLNDQMLMVVPATIRRRVRLLAEHAKELQRPRVEFAGTDIVEALQPEVDAVLAMIAEACNDEDLTRALVTDLSRVSDFPIEGTTLEGDTRYLWQVAITNMRVTIQVLRDALPAPKRTTP